MLIGNSEQRLNKLVRKKNYTKEQQNMSKVNRWLAVITMVIMLVVASSGVVSAYRPWADCHSSNPGDPYPDLEFVEQEADEVADILHGPYWGWDWHDYSKEMLIDYFLPFSDLFHFTGHGDMNWYGFNWLVTGDGEFLDAYDIPDLNGHKFDCMRFTFANACLSGRDGTDPLPWRKNLHDGFIDNGCEAFLGWDWLISDEGAYEYAILFYTLAMDYGWTVSHTRAETEDRIGTPDLGPPGVNSIIYGDGSVTITPFYLDPDNWVSPTGHNDPSNSWSYESYAYDDNTDSKATAHVTGDYLELTHSAIYCDKVRIYATSLSKGKLYDPTIDIDVYYSGAWHNIWSGYITKKTWVEKDIGSPQSVTAARVKCNLVPGLGGFYLYEFDFNSLPS